MGKRSPGRWGWLAAYAVALAALPLGSCLFESSAPAPNLGPAHQLKYSVTLSDAPAAACRIEIRIGSWPTGSPKLFQLPVYYTDNPVLPVRGLSASDLVVKDMRGATVAARDTLLSGSLLNGNFVILPAAALTVSYAVDLDPADDSRFGLPFPGVAEGVSLIDGAYFFMLPVLGKDFATHWRAPVRIALAFQAGRGNTLLGIDSEQVFSSNYGLMFVRAAVNPIKASTFTMPGHEVTSYATSSDSLDLDAFNLMLARCIRLVEDSLLPLPTYRYHVGENPVFWGIEGVQGYWFRPEAAQAVIVHVHELVHTFVGVHHSDLEDPWWKEGMTNYLGELLSVQDGLSGDTAFAAAMLASYDTVPAARKYALADPYVRDHLFQPLDSAFHDVPDAEGFLSLVYGKGAQASMILDRHLLEGSGGKASVFHLIRDLIQRHGNAFDRSQLTEAVDRLAGGSSAGFLSALLDRTTPFGPDSLAHTYSALRKMGRFGPAGGLLPIPGLDDSAKVIPVQDAPRQEAPIAAKAGRSSGGAAPRPGTRIPPGSAGLKY